MSRLSGAKKKIGRPSVDSEAVNVRMERPQLSALDAWIAAQPDPKPTRPEAIRRLLQLGLEASKSQPTPGQWGEAIGD
jgi:hypothetical protein